MKQNIQKTKFSDVIPLYLYLRPSLLELYFTCHSFSLSNFLFLVTVPFNPYLCLSNLTSTSYVNISLSFPFSLQLAHSLLFSLALSRMYASKTESSDGSVWSRGQGEGGDALNNHATALITTTTIQDSDDDFDTNKVAEDETIITDTWSTRFTNSIRNYMLPGTGGQGTGGPSNNTIPTELETLIKLNNERCNTCTNC